jgi:hypothetical protein
LVAAVKKLARYYKTLRQPIATVGTPLAVTRTG